jgi:hypothetical protein
MQKEITPSLNEIYKKNLIKSLEIIDLCFNLKEAYFQQVFPHASHSDINNMIFQDIITRKEKEWKSQKVSLKR